MYYNGARWRDERRRHIRRGRDLEPRSKIV